MSRIKNMLLNYLKLSLRLLIRNPFFTFINVVGLSVGFAVFIILWQYSRHELKSDRFHKDHDRIYRLLTEIDFTWDDNFVVFMCGYDVPIHTVRLAEKIPQVESFTRIYNQDNFNGTWIEDHSSQLFMTVKSETGDENHFIEKHVAYADSNMFKFFGMALIHGNVLNVLNDPNSVAISQQTARKYFGSKDPLNSTLLLNNTIPLTVTGVFADLPKNTHLEFEIVLSMRRLEKSIGEFKPSAKGGPVSYFKLKEGVSVASLDHLFKEDSQLLTTALNTGGGDGSLEAHLSLQPLKEIAFSNLEGDHFLPKSKAFLLVLNGIALVVLVVAWINYINLTLSMNIKRHKELATRKTIGARPADFIKQFVIESAMVNVFSLFIALTLIQLSRGFLKTFFQFHIYSVESDLLSTGLIVFLILVAGIMVTGFYPALTTMKASPRNLFERVSTAHPSMNTGNTLLIIQYTCAIVLITGVFVIQRQLDFILTKNVGINREGIVIVDLPIKQSANFRSLLKTFGNEISTLPFVANYTVSNNVVGDREENFVYLKNSSVGLVVDCNGGVDENFLKCYGIRLLAGRNFLPEHPSDTTAILISHQAAKIMNKQPGDIIGATVLVQEKDFSEVFIPAHVIGVFEDYKRTTFFSNQVSLRKGDDIGIALTYGDYMVPAQAPRKLSIRMPLANHEQALAVIKEKYDKLFPGNAFNWSFLDDNINRYYANEKIARNQIILFSLVVIAIGCLGLLGMMMQRILMKTKEIGVRKVLGAKLHHITSILLSATLKQLAIALLIGIPLAWFFTQKYMQRFTDQVDIYWWHYLIPVFTNCGIMLLSISVIVWKAARSNPVEALKYE